MTKDEYIAKIIQLLKGKGREELAQKLYNSRSKIHNTEDWSKTYNYKYSIFYIFSPEEDNEKLKGISKKDRELILQCVKLLYPKEEKKREIKNIEFWIDPEKEYPNIVNSESLENISLTKIKETKDKCYDRIYSEDYDGAITTARTLIEEICIYIIETKDKKEYKNKGNLVDIYKEVTRLFNLNPKTHIGNKNVQQILSSLIGIIQGISGLRNEYSDSHATSQEQKKYKADHRLAVLAVNSAITISDFLYRTFEKNKENDTFTDRYKGESYNDFDLSNIE